MRQTTSITFVSMLFTFYALSCAESVAAPAAMTDATESNVAVNTAVIKVGDHRWTFLLSGMPGTLCKSKRMFNKDGITAMGLEAGPDGSALPQGATVEIVVYPEDWTPSGTESNSLKINGKGEDVDWRTASPKSIKDNPDIGDLARASVKTWSLSGGWAAGTATFYREDSLSRAKFGGELMLADGSFEVLCPE